MSSAITIGEYNFEFLKALRHVVTGNRLTVISIGSLNNYATWTHQLRAYHIIKGAKATDGYNRILCNMVYYVKLDGRHIYRSIAGRNLTYP